MATPRAPESAPRSLSSSSEATSPGPVSHSGAAPLTLARPERPGAAGTILLAEPAWVVGARFLVYTLAILGCTLSLPLVVGSDGDIAAFKENGAIEWTQCMLLAVAALLLFATAAQRTFLGQSAVLLGLLVSVAATRELDSVLEAWLPLVSWKLPVVLLGLAAAAVAWRSRAVLRPQLERLLSYRGLPLLWAGFVVAVPFGQLVGHGELLEALMGDDYTRDYKRVIEETTELVGYALIVVGTIELLWQERCQGRGLVP